MFVWPPIPLQPLDDGPDRKLAHSDRLAFPITSAPAALSCWTMNASPGVLPGERPGAGSRRHAGRADVVLDDDRDAEQRPVVPAAARLVRCPRVGERRRADGDDGVEDRVELADPVEVELRQLDGRSAGASSSTSGAPGSSSRRRRCPRPLVSRRFGREAGRRRGAGHPEHEGQQGRQDKETPKSAAHRVTSTGFGWGGRWDRTAGGGDLRRGSYTHPAVRSAVRQRKGRVGCGTVSALQSRPRCLSVASPPPPPR